MNILLQTDWDEMPTAALPKRTRLYRLEPMGLGTPMIECLASYLHRLAAVHGLPTWILVCRELAPRFRRKSIVARNGHCDLFGQMGMTINGNNRSACEAVKIMEELTGAELLGRLTFSVMGDLIAEHRLLRVRQAWCPACLAEWRSHEHCVYQPLIWNLAHVSICLIHGQTLVEHCPSCGTTHRPLGRYSWSGHCPRCRTWLGHQAVRFEPGEISNVAWKRFAAEESGRFIVAMQSLRQRVSPSVFPANLIGLVESQFSGNRSALARAIGVHPETVRAWTIEDQRPSMVSLIALAYCFGIPASNWVTGPVVGETTRHVRRVAAATAVAIRPSVRRHSIQALRDCLADVVRKSEYPPPSLAAVCRRLKIHQTYAMRKEPNLAQKVMASFRKYRELRREMGARFRTIVVESAVNQLLQEGRSLSYTQMAKVLPPGISMADNRARADFLRIRKEVEQEMQEAMTDTQSEG